jgi:putative hydrolase of the HAD superfamily
VIEAVLFDWGGTLDDGAWSDEIALQANRAGLEAIGRTDVDPQSVNAWFEANEDVFRLDSIDEVDFAEITRTCLGTLGCALDDDGIEAYMHAWHGSVGGDVRVHPDAPELFDGVRERGLKMGLISNTFSPGRFLRPQLRQQGLDAALDVVVLSSDHGKRKPHPEIFRAALDELGVEPDRAVFVGDRPETDIAGAHGIGMTTVQATWFVAHDPSDQTRADYVAREPLEVLHVIDRCLAASPS